MNANKRGLLANLVWANAVVALSAFAGSATSAVWTFSGCSNGGLNATCAASGGLVARGVSNTGSGGTLAKAGGVLYSGGVGITAAGESTGSPNHAIDNSGWVDAIYLNFGQSVDLDAITIGWNQTDSDISLFRYAGSGDPWGNDLLGKTYANLTSNNWAFVGNYANLAVNVARAVNGSNSASEFWLISAYTSSAGAGCNLQNANATCDNGNDYFKVSSLTTSTPQLCGGTTGIACGSTVPEPGTIALLGVALANGLLLRRRHKRHRD